jgi:hypothetical protein
MGRTRSAMPNGDILTDDPKDLAFDTDQPCLVIVDERIDSFTEAASAGVQSYAHGLDYRPLYKIYEEIATGEWSQGLSINNTWADDTNINFDLYAGSDTYRIKTLMYANSQNGAIGTTMTNADGNWQHAHDGYDLEDITDLRQVKFSSKKGVMLINEAVSIDVDVTGQDAQFTTQYAHGLGYIPYFDAVLEVGGVVIPYVERVAAGITAFYDVTATDTHIICKVTDVGDALGYPVTVTFRVQILCGKIE